MLFTFGTRAAPQPFFRSMQTFARHPSHARSMGRPGGPPLSGLDEGLFNEKHQTLNRVEPVPFLGSKPARRYDDDPVRGRAGTRERQEPGAYGARHRRRARRVEPEFHGGRDFVDVLAARPARPCEGKRKLVFVKKATRRDGNHLTPRTPAGSTARCAARAASPERARNAASA
jgi:hypothetical protein